MKNLLLVTNYDLSIKNSNQLHFDITDKFPASSEDIKQMEEVYSNVVYIIDAEKWGFEKVLQFVEKIAKTIDAYLFLTQGFVIVECYPDNLKYATMIKNQDINILFLDKEKLLILTDTLDILAAEDVFVTSDFIEAFGRRIIFEKCFNSYDIEKIKSYLKDQTTANELEDKDIKFVIIYSAAIEQKEEFEDKLHEFIKQLNCYSCITFLPAEHLTKPFVEIYCFYGKAKHLKVFSNIQELKKRHKYRYIKFVDTVEESDICLFSGKSTINEVHCEEYVDLDVRLVITNTSKSPDAVLDGKIDEDTITDILPMGYVDNYLQLLEVFFSNRFEITMVDIIDVFAATRGRLSGYYHFYLDDDILEQLEKEIIKSSLEGNIILFVSQYDLVLLESILNALDKLFPKKNVLYILPIRIWGNLRDYVEIFVFEE